METNVEIQVHASSEITVVRPKTECVCVCFGVDEKQVAHVAISTNLVEYFAMELMQFCDNPKCADDMADCIISDLTKHCFDVTQTAGGMMNVSITEFGKKQIVQTLARWLAAGN